MGDPVLITDHADQGEDLTLEQFKERPRFLAWLRSYLAGAQEAEDAVYEVILARLIDNAVGEQLRVLGTIVGEPPKGRADAIYRLFILARIKANRSRSFAGDILAVLEILTTVAYSLDEVAPANLAIDFVGPLAVDPHQLAEMLKDAKGAGIGLRFVIPTGATGLTFSHVGDANNPALAPSSASDVPDTTGLAATAIR